MQPLEQVLFDGVAEVSGPASITVSVPYSLLSHLAFCSKSFDAKYWRDEQFYRNAATDLPFRVTKTGSLFGIDLLHGFEQSGAPQRRLFELLKVFGGQEMIPRGQAAIQDEAFRDFAIAGSLSKPSPNWSFTGFLDSMKEPIQRGVLLLGAYKAGAVESPLEQASGILTRLGYQPLLLKDAPDLPHQSNTEKLLAALMVCRFVVVIDSEPSGHIAELDQLLTLRLRPVVVVRTASHPSTAYLEDRIQTDDLFRTEVVDSMAASSLLAAFKWANDRLRQQSASYDAINSWRSHK